MGTPAQVSLSARERGLHLTQARSQRLPARKVILPSQGRHRVELGTTPLGHTPPVGATHGRTLAQRSFPAGSAATRTTRHMTPTLWTVSKFTPRALARSRPSGGL